MLQSQQPSQPSLSFSPSPSPESQKYHGQSSVAHSEQRPSFGDRLGEHYRHYKQKLQKLTLILEQEEQIGQQTINQILSYQEIAEQVRRLSDHYTQLSRNISNIHRLEKAKETKEKEAISVRESVENRKNQIKAFRVKLKVHILDNTEGIKKLLAYSVSQNMHKIMQESIQYSIHEIINNTHPCFHSNAIIWNPQQKGQAQFRQKCNQGCKFGELLEFMATYKNNKLCSRVVQMWRLMEKQVYKEISSFTRLYGEDLMMDQGLEENVNKLQKQVMNIKVDLEILNNQVKEFSKRIGVKPVQEQLNVQYLIDAVVSNIRQILLGDGLEQASDQENDINLLSWSFLNYIAHVAGDYVQEHKLRMRGSRESIAEAAIDQLSRCLQKSIQSSQKKAEIRDQIEKTQKKIHCLELQLQESQQASIAQDYEQSIQKGLGWSKQTQETHPTCGSKVRVNKRYQIEGMRFKVIKIMHISTVGLARSIISSRSTNTSYGSSKASSRIANVNLVSIQGETGNKSSRSTLATDRSKGQDCSQRILQFGKNKLILRKQNPHFHEQIQIKRITFIKVRSHTLLHIYFKKGYMSLQFIHDQDLNNVAREWVNMFQIVYYEYAGQIQYVDDEDDDGQGEKREFSKDNKENILVQSNVIIQEQQYKIELSRKQSMANFITFQNKNKQFGSNQQEGEEYTAENEHPIENIRCRFNRKR